MCKVTTSGETEKALIFVLTQFQAQKGPYPLSQFYFRVLNNLLVFKGSFLFGVRSCVNKVDVNNSKATCVAKDPFKIIPPAPDKVPLQVGTITPGFESAAFTCRWIVVGPVGCP